MRKAITGILLTIFAVVALVYTAVNSQKTSIATNNNYTVLISDEKGSGTGIFINNEFVLTAEHLEESTSGKEVFIITDNFGKKHKAKALAATKKTDLMILKLDDPITDKRIAPKFMCSLPPIGSEIYTIGQPNKFERMITFGHISMKNYKQMNDNYAFIANMAVFYGNSGGGVFTKDDGIVVGIVSAVKFFMGSTPTFIMGVPMEIPMTWPSDISFIVSPDHVCEFLEANKMEFKKIG